MTSWAERQAEIARFAERPIFFVGGAPRSGTTWLQQILDSHPDISCRGEGLFLKMLADPVDAMMADWRTALEGKNTGLFNHTSGYPLPVPEDQDFLIGTAVLSALQRQSAGKPCLVAGEKTPENVFFFPRLKGMFPHAKFIGIVRDPRDVLTSAWHFFHKPVPAENEVAAKTAFIESALPSLVKAAHAMLAINEAYESDTMVISYEALSLAPVAAATALFRFLGVSQTTAIVEACVSRTAFVTMTEGRPKGVELKDAFHRKGITGDWRTALTPEMNKMILDTLGWAFPRFGWSA